MFCYLVDRRTEGGIWLNFCMEFTNPSKTNGELSKGQPEIINCHMKVFKQNGLQGCVKVQFYRFAPTNSLYKQEKWKVTLRYAKFQQ